ncbi:hypothetical protein HPB48_012823 [Haemaphysalis longicornis]|uniref:MoaB/Mog domain-containing protein n=1 Tax=Haemaphysalis longicornis TaxID=44386 RepID=A0A9J6GNE3_HAELO|nr:hypothetical protein HPB48_012823 [Haemaphysalis longicornis]
MDAERQITTGILTVSDRCSNGQAEDTSGANLENIVNGKKLINGKVVVRKCVPDDFEAIRASETLKQWSDVHKLDLILTTGGTGFSERDITPEVLPRKQSYRRKLPGIAVAMTQKSLNVTPMAMLSRAVCGIRKRTLIINLPGSRKGAQECLEFASPAIPHAIDQLQERRYRTDYYHTTITGCQEIEVKILKAPVVGQDIRQLGSDIEKGQHVLARGTKLSPSDLGLLATVGATAVVPPGAALKPGQIRDSNKTTLLALLGKNGFPASDAGIARDDFEDHVKKLKAAFEVADIVVSSGGVSMGEKDLLKTVLVKEFAAIIHFGRVFMKPGKPTAFASLTYGDRLKLVFGLPGNPVSATVTCQLYVLPALRKMSGHTAIHPTSIKAKLAEDIALDPRPEYHRAVLSWSQGSSPLPVARSTGNQISSRLLSFQGANVLLVLPPASADTSWLPAGTTVDALLIDMI